jgi:Flp pilus assembly protein TadG
MSTGIFKRIFTRERRRGNVIIETGLVSILFFTLLFGVIDIGQFLFVHHALVQRARNSIRWGAINNIDDTAAIQNKILYNQSTAKTDGSGNPATVYVGL